VTTTALAAHAVHAAAAQAAALTGCLARGAQLTAAAALTSWRVAASML
jgi:hypothetical protein